jgi:ethanolamine utilization protein EutQ (cupin superfamily)
MPVRKFVLSDVDFERSPDQVGEVYAGNLVDQRHGAPVTIGFGRWGPGAEFADTMAVDDVMVVLAGRLSVTSGRSTVEAGPGEIVHMPKGEAVVIRAHAEGATTAYVTYPYRQAARG